MVTITPRPLPSFPIYNAVRQCTDCRLRHGCVAPVPGAGPVSASIMVVGESPGEQEDVTGVPFTGQTGRLLDHLFSLAGISRPDVYVTNIIKCPSYNDPGPQIASRCAKNWLDGLEIKVVRPKIIVAMGQAAIRHILRDHTLTVEHTHGIPRWIDGPDGPRTVMVYPTYNPAAGLHTTNQLRPIWSDWQVLGNIIDGADPLDYVPMDQYPNPQYVRVTNEKDAEEILHLPQYALDTETIPVGVGEAGRNLIGASASGVGTDPAGRPHRLWSVQVSQRPGTAWFIPAELIPDPQTAIPKTSTVYVHNYLYDCQFIRIPTPVDTMVMAYLLGLPQGLKELAYRLAGMEMHSYQEYVGGGEDANAMAMAYLRRVLERESEWSAPEPLTEDRWSNKLGILTRVTRRPWHIVRKARRILDDHTKSFAGIDVSGRWRDIDPRERRHVESVLGAMPEPSLADIDINEAVHYSSRDADATWRIRGVLLDGIKRAGLETILYRVDLPVLEQAEEMMNTGMRINPDHFRALSARYLEELKAAAWRCKIIGGRSAFNPNSPDQVAELLYTPEPKGLGFPITRRTPTGKASTDDRELKKIDHPVVDEIIDYRGTLKNKTTYADALVEQADPVTQRIHTTVRLTRTETGRTSNSDPNMQNIPIRTEEGRIIRQGFIASSPEHCFLELDYSQIELRVLAHMSGAQGLLTAFQQGLDPHTVTASLIFKCSLEGAKEYSKRQIGKVVNFGIGYGMGPMGLMEYLIEQGVSGWSLPDCEKMLADYDEAVPEVKAFRVRQINHAVRHGYVEDLLGRRRYLPEVVCPIPRIRAEGGRMAGNMPIQATAQDIIKMAGSRILWLRENGQCPTPDFRLLLQIHDALLFELRKRDAMVFAHWAKGVMENVFTISVPLVVDAKTGNNWGQMEKLELEG